MIARLRKYQSGGHYKYEYDKNNYRWRHKWYPGRRLFTDEQIMEVMSLTKERFDYLTEYHRTEVPPRYLSNEEWKKRYWKFWDKHKRWHTAADLKNWRKTGLFSRRHWLADGEWMQHYCAMRQGTLRKHPEMVFTIPNLTTRRNVINRMGGADLLVKILVEQGKAEKLQQDDFGILWKLNFRDGADNHMRYVEVINSTPNEDGEYDHYFLRVPPTVGTARRGVAWTFNQPYTGFKFVAQS